MSCEEQEAAQLLELLTAEMTELPAMQIVQAGVESVGGFHITRQGGPTHVMHLPRSSVRGYRNATVSTGLDQFERGGVITGIDGEIRATLLQEYGDP